MTRRLVLSYVTVAVLVLLCLEIPLGFLYGRGERARLEGELEHSAEVLAASVDDAISDRRPEDLAALAADNAGRLGGRIIVVDRAGGLLSTSHRLHPSEAVPADLPEIRAALRGHGHIGIRISVVDGVRSLSVAVPTEPGATVRGAVRVTVPTSTVDTRIARFWWSLVAAAVAVLAVVTLLAFALARWISRPVHALEHATRHLADGTRSVAASTTTGPVELRRLAGTFNRTAERLRHLIETQRSFAGNASHQLKTPLAALRLRLENLEPDISAEAGGTLAAAITETDRLARMVESLLALASLDEAPTAPVPVDLDSAVIDRTALWQPLAGRGHVRLAVAGGPVGLVHAVPGAVEQILDNLLANALDVAPPGSTVTVERRHAAGPPAEGPEPVVQLHVVDQGPGLSEQDRVRAFDRFWRAPQAPKGGTGLGLALVQQLTEASGGHVELRAAPGRGVRAVVTLVPAGRPDDPVTGPPQAQGPASESPGLRQASAQR